MTRARRKDGGESVLESEGVRSTPRPNPRHGRVGQRRQRESRGARADPFGSGQHQASAQSPKVACPWRKFRGAGQDKDIAMRGSL